MRPLIDDGVYCDAACRSSTSSRHEDWRIIIGVEGMWLATIASKQSAPPHVLLCDFGIGIIHSIIIIITRHL
jgi:hypothetical protein